MKKLIIAFAFVALVSCNASKNLEYDPNPINISQSVTIQPKETYLQRVEVPSRGINAEVQIKNNSNTVKYFIVNVKEVK